MRDKIVAAIRQNLTDNADAKRRETSDRFFKQGERARVYGVSMTVAGRIAKGFWPQVKTWPKQDIFDLCEELWKSGYFEEAVVACTFSEALHKQYEPADFKVFEHWVNDYVNNWADCDTLCNHTVGDFVMMYPQYVGQLKKWALSQNRWTKRGAAATLIIPARKGMFLDDIFEIADTLLTDSDDMVQKGYGWMLKAASQAHPEKVLDYVMSKKAVMPRTALRYAIEKLPPELKAGAMKR